jgi:wobble nucleotide-excising tRNase
MVYNREFRRNNFDQDAGIPGVFTLGEATIEEIKTLEELKQNLGNKRDLYNIFAIFRNFQTRFRIRKQWHPAREKSQKQACGRMYEQN